MGLEAVISEIQQKGRFESDRIRHDGMMESERILRDAQQRSDEIKLQAEADVTRQVEHVLAQVTSSANLVTKRATLNAEKEPWTGLRGGACRYPEGASRIPRTRAPEPSHDREGRDRRGARPGNRADLSIIDALVKEPGFAVFTVGPSSDIEGGLLAESIDGAFQVDHSYRTYLNRVWEISLKDASDLLFR